MIGVLHTTESAPGTFRAVANFFDRNPGSQPHVLFDPSTGESVQFLAAYDNAKALFNAPGGVETNRRPGGVFQVEIVGYAADVGSYDDEWYSRLQAYLVQWSTILDIPYRFFEGDRLSPEAWVSAPDQWYGHCHVPENDHWDPGTLDLSRLRIPLQKEPATPMLEIGTLLTSGKSLNDHILWTNETVNKILALLQAAPAPAPADIRTFTTAELLAELVRRQAS